MRKPAALPRSRALAPYDSGPRFCETVFGNSKAIPKKQRSDEG